MKKFLAALFILAAFPLSSSAEIANMTLREKIGQLFIIRPEQLITNLKSKQVHSNNDYGTSSLTKSMLETLKKYPAGGFALFTKNIDSPEQLKAFTKGLIEASEHYPIIAIDEEGGKISRIANHKNFRVAKFKNAESIAGSNQTRTAAESIAAYLKEFGFNMDFAPVADINTNPKNRVIGTRAFGDDPEFVSRNVSEYLDGLHAYNIAGSMKHFPGHGDTQGDTHTQTVSVHKTWKELLKSELIPFINNLDKADSVMIAHIRMKKVTRDNLPATLSRELVTNKLRGELGYNGVIITDAMNMEAISKHYGSSNAAVKAIEAGCDIILMPDNYIKAFNGVLNAVKSGRISEQRINESVERIMTLKKKMQTQNLNLKWWQKKPVYQIYPKSFLDSDKTGTGDIKGITRRLDYLKSLNIGAVWLTPIYPSPMIDNGYDISDYTGINKSFGSMKDFDELIREADKRGIKIIMDLVFNHSSDQHKWFLESKSSRDNPKADWYIWRDSKPDGGVPTNWRSIFGGSAWTWCEQRQQYYLHTFAKEQPDLNWENPEVRQALYDSANFWLSKGVGGFRIDAIVYIKKPAEFIDGKPDAQDGTINIHNMTANQPGILDFLREFKQNVFAGHDIFTVGEANGVKPEELSLWVGSDGVFDMLFEFSHVNLAFDESETWCRPVEWKLADLKRALTASQNATRNNGWYPAFFENHDQPRCVNHFFPAGVDTDKAAKVIAAILLTLRGTPFIYQGQELGMTNINWDDINIYNDISSHGQYNIALSEGFSPQQAMKFVKYFSRDNARTPMQWTSGKNAGFSSAKTWLPVNENYKRINAEREEKDSDSVLNFYKALMKLRENHNALIAGSYREILSDSEELFAFERELNGEKFITVANFSLKPVRVPDSLTGKIILSSEKNINPSEIKPLEARIYHQ
ncbi:MAG: DUF3459 domain-containing protein [Synergistaceae bacterium]|nr:DUF3459 domain-containing protein [Synergistaceae bacterium]